jgi:hypothetical protein
MFGTIPLTLVVNLMAQSLSWYQNPKYLASKVVAMNIMAKLYKFKVFYDKLVNFVFVPPWCHPFHVCAFMCLFIDEFT